MPFDDDVREPEDVATIAPTVAPRSSAWPWAPARLFECMRCSAVTLTREARCGRCGWRDGT